MGISKNYFERVSTFASRGLKIKLENKLNFLEKNFSFEKL